jgi:hypothetical protein
VSADADEIARVLRRLGGDIGAAAEELMGAAAPP